MRCRGSWTRGSETVRLLGINIIAATDELRKEGSKFYTMHCQMEREKQLMDK